MYETIDQLTTRGREFMTFVGQERFDFFDGGIREGEGNWGKNMSWQLAEMTGTTDRSSNGVMVATKKLGLWETTEDEGDMWWYLTALGAEVANHLASEAPKPVLVEVETVQELEESPEQVIEIKRGPKWTYLHIDGVQVLEVRSEFADQTLAAFGP